MNYSATLGISDSRNKARNCESVPRTTNEIQGLSTKRSRNSGRFGRKPSGGVIPYVPHHLAREQGANFDSMPMQLESEMPFRVFLGYEAELAERKKAISYCVEALSKFFNEQRKDEGGNVTCEKLASLIGRIEAVSGDIAHVTATNQTTGERFEAECDASYLRDRGIEEGMEFQCTVMRKSTQTVVEFVPLAPRVLSEKELEEISREVDSRLG